MYIWERIYPHVIAISFVIILKKAAINPINSNKIDSLIDGIITLDSIIIGFMGAIIPVILSMKNESKLVKYVFDRDKDGLFKKYISETIAYGLADICISLSVYIRDILINVHIMKWIKILFVYTFILFIVATYRSMSCMLKLIFTQDSLIEDSVSNKLDNEKSSKLWEKRSK